MEISILLPKKDSNIIDILYIEKVLCSCKNRTQLLQAYHWGISLIKNIKNKKEKTKYFRHITQIYTEKYDYLYDDNEYSNIILKI
jgi:hypothetical protein